jgi:hypothetical protein
MAHQRNQRAASIATDAATDAIEARQREELHIRYLQEMYAHTTGLDQSPLTEINFQILKS